MSAGPPRLLAPIRGCRHRCLGCGEPGRGHPTRRADGPALLRAVDRLLGQGARAIHFGGGEPLLHPALPEALARARAGGARTALHVHAAELRHRARLDPVLPLLDELAVGLPAGEDALADRLGAGRGGLGALAAVRARFGGMLVVRTALLAPALPGLPALAREVLALRPVAWAVGPAHPVPGADPEADGLAPGPGDLRRAGEALAEAIGASPPAPLRLTDWPACTLPAGWRAAADERRPPPRGALATVLAAPAAWLDPAERRQPARERPPACDPCTEAACRGPLRALVARRGAGGLRPFLPPAPVSSGARRAPRVFNVGLPRTGTATVAALLEGRHDHAFEPTARQLVAWARGDLDEPALRRFLVEREPVPVESSSFLHHVAHLLPDLFPEARWIVTCRPVYGQVASILDHTLRMHARGDGFTDWQVAYARLLVPRFEPADFASFEALEPRLAWYVEAFARAWARGTAHLLAHLGPDRALWIPTAELSHAAERLAAHTGREVRPIRPRRRNASPRRPPWLDRLPPEEVEAAVRPAAGPVMDRLFPGMDLATWKASGRP